MSALQRAFERLRPDAAVGVDGVTKEMYGQGLDDNLRDLHERLRSKRYRHQPIRRVHIPKGNGRTRPLGISALDGEELTTPDAGTAQGSVLSPLLANVYLHYVLDLWFEREVKPRMRGLATLIR